MDLVLSIVKVSIVIKYRKHPKQASTPFLYLACRYNVFWRHFTSMSPAFAEVTPKKEFIWTRKVNIVTWGRK